MNDPPPTPELCGSTSPSMACMATAASMALPPLRRISAPASAATGFAAATMAGTLRAVSGARAATCPAYAAQQIRPTTLSSKRSLGCSIVLARRNSSARAKRSRCCARIQIRHFHGSHFGGRGADPQLALQLLQRARLAKGQHFDTAIGQVVGVAGNCQRARVLRDGGPVEHTLYAP